MDIKIPVLSSSYSDLSVFDFSFKDIAIYDIQSTVTKEYIKIRDELAQQKVRFVIWDNDLLNKILMNYPRIVSEIFGRAQNHFWARHMCGDEMVDRWLVGQKDLPPKTKYSQSSSLIPRVIFSDIKKVDHKHNPWQTHEQTTLIDVVNKGTEKRVILLGVAGSGKSEELKSLAAFYSTKDQFLHPISCSFKDYTDQSFEDFISSFQPRWLEIPENQRLILLDAFDEVEPNQLEAAGKKLNLFSTKYPNSYIVVSARNNFYKEQLDNFKSYHLRNLSDSEILNYLKGILSDTEVQQFKKLAKHNKVWSLFANVFNLVEFVKLYKDGGASKFPKNRTEAFEMLIRLKIQANQKHQLTTNEDEAEHYQQMRETLERLAIAMEQMGVNHVSKDTYVQIVPERKQRELLKHSPLVHVKAKGTDDWQFEHNNYQEYLAAIVLSRQSFTQIQSIISFAPDFHKVKPKWINTLSFLMGILGAKDSKKFKQVFEWLMQIEPEVFVKFEREIIPSNVRLKIFKSIFEHYCAKGMYIWHASLHHSELAEMGGNERPFLIYLASELKRASGSHLYNVLETFIYIDRYYEQEPQLRNSLMKVLQAKQDQYVHKRAAAVLFKIGYGGRADLDKVIKTCPNIKTNPVRDAILDHLCTNDLCDAYVDFILDTIITRTEEFKKRNVHEFGYYVEQAIIRCKTAKAVNKILDFCIKNFQQVTRSGFEDNLLTEVVMKNVTETYRSGNGIFGRVLDLLVLSEKHHSERITKLLSPFFESTKTGITAFKKLYTLNLQDYEKAHLLAAVSDKSCIVYVLSQYEQGKIEDNTIKYFRYALHSKKELHDSFYNEINRITAGKFRYADPINHDEIKANQHKQDLILLKGKQSFLVECETILNNIGGAKATWKQLWDYRNDVQWGDINLPHTIVIETLRDLSRDNEGVTWEIVRTRFSNQEKWSDFVVGELASMLKNGEQLDQWHINFLIQWCLKCLRICNFKTAVQPRENGYSVRSRENMFEFLWSKLNFSLPDETLLDMLSLDSSGLYKYQAREEETQTTLSDLIVERISDIDKVKRRICQNLKAGISVDFVCGAHLYQCNQLLIEESAPYILKAIKKDNIREYEKVSAAEIYINLNGDKGELLRYVATLSGSVDWHWGLIRLVHPLFKEKCEKLIKKWFLTSIEETFKLNSLEYLLKIGDADAFIFFIEWIKKNKSYPLYLERRIDITFYKPEKVVPKILNLLLDSYSKEFAKKSVFDDCSQQLLNDLWHLALKTQSNFAYVKSAVSELIENNKSNIEDIKGLNYWLQKLEREYYLNKGDVQSIKEVLATTQHLFA